MILSDIFMFLVAMLGSILTLIVFVVVLSVLTANSHWAFLIAFLVACGFGGGYLYLQIGKYL